MYICVYEKSDIIPSYIVACLKFYLYYAKCMYAAMYLECKVTIYKGTSVEKALFVENDES